MSHTTMTVPAGDTLRWDVELADADGIDLDGTTIRAVISARPDIPLVTLTVGSGIEVITALQVDDSPAVFRCTLTGAQTELLGHGKYTVESKVRWVDETVVRASHDTLVIQPSSLGDLEP